MGMPQRYICKVSMPLKDTGNEAERLTGSAPSITLRHRVAPEQ